jgi:hypothetical protein
VLWVETLSGGESGGRVIFGNEKGERGSEIGAVARGNRKGKMKEKGKGVHGQPGREGEREREKIEKKEEKEKKERERKMSILACLDFL